MTEDLQRNAEIMQMSKTGAWSDFKIMIDGWVAESHEQMHGCLASMETRGILSFRYSQRLALQREIENWVAKAVDSVAEITEEMRRDLNEQPDYSTSTIS